MAIAIDLFAGGGGLSLGLRWSGFDIALANDIDKDSCATHRLNHHETTVIQDDIRNVDFVGALESIGIQGKVNLIAGGPPCQGFSTVGSKKEDDERNMMFCEYLRVVEKVHPDFVLFENVSGFRSMYGGKMYRMLLAGLDHLGYDIWNSVLNAVNFGVPQSRRRTIVVGFRKGFDFTPPAAHYASRIDSGDLFNSRLLSPMTLKDAIYDLPFLQSGEGSTEYRSEPQSEYQRKMRGEISKLTEHECPNHGEHLLKILQAVPIGGSIMDVPKELRPKNYFSNSYGRLKWDEPSSTITGNLGTPSSNRCVHPECNRGLTTREGARIQGFPDSYAFVGKRGSKNQQIGNAVPPILGYKLGLSIIRSLQKGR